MAKPILLILFCPLSVLLGPWLELKDYFWSDFHKDPLHSPLLLRKGWGNEQPKWGIWNCAVQIYQIKDELYLLGRYLKLKKKKWHSAYLLFKNTLSHFYLMYLLKVVSILYVQKYATCNYCLSLCFMKLMYLSQDTPHWHKLKFSL